MASKIAQKDLYRIRAHQNFHRDIRRDITLLRDNRADMSLTTVVMCCIDALAAGSGTASRGKFERFVERHFPELCQGIAAACPGHVRGSSILYDKFRNGFAHLRGPKSGFAIAEDHELAGRWADTLEVEGSRKFVAINLDKLTERFLECLN